MAQASHQHIVLGNLQPGFGGQQPQLIQNSKNLRGSVTRLVMGHGIIICGIIEIVLMIELLTSFELYCSLLDIVGWGIWNGAFAVLTGFFGVFSRKSKCKVIAFMVLAIIATPMSLICGGFQATLASCKNGNGHSYDHDDQDNRVTYIMISVTYALQACFCIVGAAFTCTALSSDNQPQQAIIYQPHPVAPPAIQSYGLHMDQPPPYNPNF
ncbi:uncharacterized protein [Apostichopus japonicus]|uniref:uncharacterized protein isoform X2 n=1 Tax=Stichopus japonicus TaxID=307972 RepID=UPI003AB3B0BE